MVDIVIFENNPIPTNAGVQVNNPLPTTKDINGVPVGFMWHRKWNALGNARAAFAVDTAYIDANANFYEALQWCSGYRGSAICFFDFKLDGVVVDGTHVAPHIETALAVTGMDTIQNAVAFFNQDAHGLLLAIVLATNCNADADVWLATNEHAFVNIGDYLNRLRMRKANNIRVIGNSNSLTANPRNAIVAINDGVCKYVEARDRGTGLVSKLWPDYAKDWFNENLLTPNDSPAPHKHSDYLQIQAQCIPLHDYLVALGVHTNIAKAWLNQKGCYETLKHFLGACAVAHMGDRCLTLGSLVFPLVLATNGKSLMEAFQWNVSAVGIMDKDKAKSRNLILKALHLFKALAPAPDEDSVAVGVKAKFENKTDGMHLLIDFPFDCSIGKSVECRSLLAKAMMFSWGPVQGDTCKALWDFLGASVSCDSKQLFTSLYPVKDGGRVWSRLDFKANS